MTHKNVVRIFEAQREVEINVPQYLAEDSL